MLIGRRLNDYQSAAVGQIFRCAPNLPQSAALGVPRMTNKDGGDTELAFIGALSLWLLVSLFSWVASHFYYAWQSNEPIEFTSRGLRFMNLLPASIQFAISVSVVAFFTYEAAKQSVKFVKLLRG